MFWKKFRVIRIFCYPDHSIPILVRITGTLLYYDKWSKGEDREKRRKSTFRVFAAHKRFCNILYLLLSYSFTKILSRARALRKVGDGYFPPILVVQNCSEHVVDTFFLFWGGRGTKTPLLLRGSAILLPHPLALGCGNSLSDFVYFWSYFYRRFIRLFCFEYIHNAVLHSRNSSFLEHFCSRYRRESCRRSRMVGE